MNEDLKKLLRDRFTQLPQEVQNYLQSDAFSNLIQQIGTKHDLSDQSTNLLEDELVLVLMGLDSAQDLPVNLQAALDLPTEQTTAITSQALEAIPEQIVNSVNAHIQNQTLVKPWSLDEQQFQKRYEALPDNLKQMYSAEKTEQDMQVIAAQFSLGEESAQRFEDLVRMRLLGFVRRSEFQPKLMTTVGVDSAQAEQMAQAVEEKIFSKIAQQPQQPEASAASQPKAEEDQYREPTA